MIDEPSRAGLEASRFPIQRIRPRRVRAKGGPLRAGHDRRFGFPRRAVKRAGWRDVESPNIRPFLDLVA